MSGIYKNGTIISNSFSNDYPIMDMKILITNDNAIFARILHHNNKNGTILFTANNVLNIQTDDLYSRLYLMEQFRNSNEEFEFIVLQPDVDDKIYRWKQTSNPCTESTCVGYENISNTEYGIKYRNNYTFICIDDDNNTNKWYQAIGSYNNHTKDNITGVPAFDDKINPGVLDFYVRCDNIKNLNKFSIYDKTIVSNEFYEI